LLLVIVCPAGAFGQSITVVLSTMRRGSRSMILCSVEVDPVGAAQREVTMEIAEYAELDGVGLPV
jgi:hypothetical protein